MANKKISQLDEATTAQDNDLFVIARGIANYKIKKSTIITKANETEIDLGIDDNKYITPKAVKDSKNVPHVTPGSNNNVIISNNSTWTKKNINEIRLNELAVPDDVTTHNATTGRPGLLPKLDGNYHKSLRGDGTWATNGHIIKKGNTTLQQRDNLKFDGVNVDVKDNGSDTTEVLLSDFPLHRQIINSNEWLYIPQSYVYIIAPKLTIFGAITIDGDLMLFQESDGTSYDKLMLLNDVSLSNVSNNQVLSYDSSSNKWKNKNINDLTIRGHYIKDNGNAVSNRDNLNFSGSGVTISTDTENININISGVTIQDNGNTIPGRNVLNFIDFDIIDDPANNRINIDLRELNYIGIQVFT